MGTNRNHTSHLVKGNILAVSAMAAGLLWILYRILLTRIIGDQGNSSYSAALEIFALLFVLTSGTVPQVLAGQVAVRVSAGQRKNALRVFRCGLVTVVIASLICEAAVFFGADFLTGTLLLTPESVYALKAAVLALPFAALAAAFRGYFQGMGTPMPTALSRLVEMAAHLIAGLLLAKGLFRYGQKVGAVLDNDVWGPAYGAAGGSLGIAVSYLVTLIVLLIIWGLFRQVLKKQETKDHTKIRESYSRIAKSFFAALLPGLLFGVLSLLGILLGQGLFRYLMADGGAAGVSIVSQWGIYSGKFLVLAGLPAALTMGMASAACQVLPRALEEEAMGAARKRTELSVRFTMFWAIPIAIGTAVLASPILQLLFKDSEELSAGLLQRGAALAVLGALAVLTIGILMGMKKMAVLAGNAAISLLIYAAGIVLMMKVWELEIYAVLYAGMAAVLLMCVLNLLSIRKHLHYRQEVVRTFVIPVIAAAVMGIVMYLTDMGLMKLTGKNIAAVLVSIPIGILIYVFLLLFLKGVTRQELVFFPFGGKLYAAARSLKLFR